MLSPTYFGLLAEFRAAEIPLEACCEKYFGLTIAQAKRKAAIAELPVPVYRSTKNKKSPWLIDAAIFASHLDEMKKEASKIHQNVNSDFRVAS